MDYSLPSSSVHGILQARILEWVAISLSRGSSQLKGQTRVSRKPGSPTFQADSLLSEPLRSCNTHGRLQKKNRAQGEHFAWAGRALAWCCFPNVLIHICGMALQYPMAMKGNCNCSVAFLSFFFFFFSFKDS